SNLGLEKRLNSLGINLIRTKVGDRFVTEEMINRGCNLGGEQSGHIILSDYNTTGDGMITAIQLLYILKEQGLKLSDLSSNIKLYPQVLINVECPTKKDFKSIPRIQNKIKEAEKSLSGIGRILVRASGTEPKIRVMVEAEHEELAKKWASEVAEVIKSTMQK
ncbi:MAG: phosphoglucosamine mutase, partial [Thermodesulfovibrionales bacterium]|nr:phosphoglucosamine mutase [Thermodesulfovibrionales bacterium]